MKLAIIGCNGFIGSRLVALFTAAGFHVTGCDMAEKPVADCRYLPFDSSPEGWNRFFITETFDYCINAAGSGNVGYSVQHPLADFQANTAQVAEILDALRCCQPSCRYLHISSAAVYGNPTRLPVSEDAACRPLSPYGWHKWMAELICREYVELHNMRIAIVRPFSIYGPGLRKQLFWDTFQKYLSSPDNVELWGTGHESRDFIYIDDVAEAFRLILEKGDMKGEVYNLASGTETSIHDAVRIMFGKMGTQTVVRFNGQAREGDPLNWRADIERLRALGFQPSFSLEEGMAKLAQWLNSMD